MKKLICFLLVMVMVLGLCACGAAEETVATTEAKEDLTGLRVGFGRASIVPDIIGVEIAGGDASARISTGYLDEVAATCIAISEGDETILLYTIDFITVDQNVYNAQKYISEATGIPEFNILLNTTHTHSGVSIRSKWTGDAAYRQKYQEAAVQAAKDAIADQSAATMFYGSTMTEKMVFVRHYLMNDGTTYGNGHGSTASGYKSHAYDADGELQVIKFARAAEDKKDIVLMNLGAHATIMNGVDAKMISADWPGAARQYVEENSDSLCAVFEAAAGDQIPNSKIPGEARFPNKHPEFGYEIGRYCVEVISGEMTQATGTGINLKVTNYTQKTMKEGLDDPELFAKASEINALKDQYGSSHDKVKAKVNEYGFPSVYEATGLVSRSGYPETYTMELHYMDIDGVSFIFAPFEMFGVTGREIKDNSPYDMTFVITCSENATGNHMGYIPHEYACEESFYEYDVTKFARGTAEDLAVKYVELLTELKNG